MAFILAGGVASRISGTAFADGNKSESEEGLADSELPPGWWLGPSPRLFQTTMMDSHQPQPRRRPPGRAPQTDPNNADYTDAEIEFMLSMDAEKRRLDKTQLTDAEILKVARRLGYRKVAPTSELPRFRRKP